MHANLIPLDTQDDEGHLHRVWVNPTHVVYLRSAAPANEYDSDDYGTLVYLSITKAKVNDSYGDAFAMNPTVKLYVPKPPYQVAATLRGHATEEDEAF